MAGAIRRESFVSDGLTFTARAGGPGTGELVLLLHGFPEDASSWELVEPALHAAGLRTLAPDQRGYSPGARPRDIRRYQVKHLVADALAAADHAGAARFHVVGHDWGAMVAWEVARRHPERVLTLTALSVAHPSATLLAARRPAQALRSSYILAFGVPFLMEALWTASGLGRGLRHLGVPRPFAERYGARFGSMADLWGPLAWYRALPLSLLDVAGRRAAREVRVPTTYVWGSADPYVDRSAAELTSRFVNSDYRFVELDAGHWLPEAHADDVVPHLLARLRHERPSH